MGLVLVTPPAVEPVTVAEAKSFMRIDHATDDTLIGSLITAAREHAEMWTRRRFITSTWRYTLPEFPRYGYEIELPYPPLQSVTSVTYLDENDASQTLAAANYTVVSADHIGRIVLDEGESWPSLSDLPGAVTITYVAGYGLAVAVPETIKTAIKLLVSNWYEQREPTSDRARSELPFGVKSLLSGVRANVYA